MTIKLAKLNVRCFRDRIKAVRLLLDVFSLGVGVTSIKETQFVCDVDACLLSKEFAVYSSYGDQLSRVVFQGWGRLKNFVLILSLAFLLSGTMIKQLSVQRL